MHRLGVSNTASTATRTKSSISASTQRKSVLLGVRKVSGLELQTARVWNIHISKNTSKSLLNSTAFRIWHVGMSHLATVKLCWGGLKRPKGRKPSLGNAVTLFFALSLSECPKPVVQYGFTSGSQDDKVYYTCNEGYKLFKKGWWGEATCTKGSWSGLEQCIGN